MTGASSKLFILYPPLYLGRESVTSSCELELFKNFLCLYRREQLWQHPSSFTDKLMAKVQ